MSQVRALFGVRAGPGPWGSPQQQTSDNKSELTASSGGVVNARSKRAAGRTNEFGLGGGEMGRAEQTQKSIRTTYTKTDRFREAFLPRSRAVPRGYYIPPKDGRNCHWPIDPTLPNANTAGSVEHDQLGGTRLICGRTRVPREGAPEQGHRLQRDCVGSMQ